MKKVYMAGPLFNDMERERNLKIDALIRDAGFETYLPQRDGGIVAKMKEAALQDEFDSIETKIFKLDIKQLDECDYLLFLLDGAVLDDGSCFELGYMYSLGKKCFGYKSDLRNWGDGKLNLMIEKSLVKIAKDENELQQIFTELGKE
jgi:nucleoside 2-deoxyribosyltransferase